MSEIQENTKQRLKVLLITGLPPPEHGGIINWTRIVCRELRGRDDLELLLVDTSVRYPILFGKRTLSRLLFGSCLSLRVIFAALRVMWSKRPDILHLNTSGSFGNARDIIILSMAIIFKVRTIAHYHLQKPPAEIPGSLNWFFLRRTMSLADTVVVLDKKSEACVRAVLPHKKITILPTMVEIDVIDALRREDDLSPPDSGSAAKIVFVGFITPVKGVSELVQACLKIDDLRWELDLIGNILRPSLQKEAKALALKAGKPDAVRFHGNMDHADALRFILKADFLVLPSHAESAPAVVIEAMGCGKPVVGTFTGAVPEMLDIGGPQQCGVCVPTRNIEALAEAIRRLIRDPQLRCQWGCTARRRAEQVYNVPVGCKQLADLWYETSLQSPPSVPESGVKPRPQEPSPFAE